MKLAQFTKLKDGIMESDVQLKRFVKIVLLEKPVAGLKKITLPTLLRNMEVVVENLI